MHIGQRDLRRRDQVIPLARAKEVVFEFRELPGREKRFGVGEKRRQDLGVAVLPCVQVEHEGRQRAGEARSGSGEHGESSAGQSGAAVEVEDLESGPEIPVGLRGKGKRPRLPPGPLDTVGGLVLAARHRVLRDIGDSHLHRGQIPARALFFFLELSDFLLESLHLGQAFGRRSAADGGELVSPAPFFLQARDGLAPKAIELREPLDAGAGEALGHFGEQPRRVLPQELAW